MRASRQPETALEPLDDYWLRTPSDRKWGTLTLAATRLAERRAEARRRRTTDAVQTDSLATARTSNNSNNGTTSGAPIERAHEQPVAASRLMRSTGCEHLRAQELAQPADLVAQHTGSRTLPRSFGPGLSVRIAERRLLDGQEHNQSDLDQSLHPEFGLKPGQSSEQIRMPVPNLTRVHPVTHYLPATEPAPSTSIHQQLHQRSFSYIEPPIAGNFWPSLVNWQQVQLAQNDVTNQSHILGAGLAHGRAPLVTHNPTCWLKPESSELLDSSLVNLGRKSFARATLPLANYDHPGQVNQMTSVLSPPNWTCPFYPVLNIAQQQQQQGAASAASPIVAANEEFAGDDPLLTNACLGSYKRKHKRPHIEAQFTMTRSPEQEELGVGQERLFVRPAGCPPTGQKSQQRRLRPPAELAQVGEIGAAEKIESYLRHCESAGSLARSCSNLETAQPVALDELEDSEITFQPYYNLPSLKYTIQLPLRKSADGRLLLEQSAHLHATRRLRRSLSPSPDALARSAPAAPSPADRRKRRLGSSSSCPAGPSIDQSAPSQQESRYSLDSVPQSRLKLELDDIPFQRDSLERSLNELGPIHESISSAKLAGNHPHNPPPPIPPHRGEPTRRLAEPATLACDQVPVKRASPGQDSDSSTRSGSSSNGTTTEEVGVSESLTHDQSVDENYEFDLISSCSSSRVLRKQLRPNLHKTSEIQAKSSTLEKQTANANIRGPLVLERSHYYHVSQQKEQTLHKDTNPHYDSIYEVPPDENPK